MLTMRVSGGGCVVVCAANQMDSMVESVSVQLQRHIISMACSSAVLVDEFAYDKTQVQPGSRLRTLLSVPLQVRSGDGDRGGGVESCPGLFCVVSATTSDDNPSVCVCALDM